MGLFYSHDKPGKGIDPDAPQKRGFFRFFDIYFRKFWHFGKATLLYTAALIPTFPIIFFLMFIFSGAMAPDGGAEIIFKALMFTNLYIALWGAGPATAGITYIMRNFAREEHAWLWSDFKDNVKDNFKQALAVFLIDIVVAVLFYVSITVYSNTPGLMGMLKYVVYFLIFLYTMMHLYIYPMMVTFELSLKDLYKNAVLFAFCKFPTNLFVIAVQCILHIALPSWAAVNGGTYWVFLLFLVLMLECVLTQGFGAFLNNFCVYPAIKKYMIDVIEEDK